MTIDVRKNDELHRYEAVTEDGAVAGFAEFIEDSRKVTFTHTEVDKASSGQGIAGMLARTALDATRATGKSVVPLCPYFKGFIEKHDEYADLVA